MVEEGNSFVVKSPKFVFIVMFTFAVECFIFILVNILGDIGIIEDNIIGIDYYLFFPGAFVSSLAYSLYYSPLKITVSGGKIAVARFPKIRREYTIHDITRLKMGFDSLLVYAGEKRILRVEYTSSGFRELIDCFERNEIPLFDFKRVRIAYTDTTFFQEEWDE
ncbi:MAG: hypothetical protein LBM28_00295 [Oscillospiraceae bacterium]|jgi:hypothetical protein|nr:hypothetical protein [Oscillospiraceae bacterium]